MTRWMSQRGQVSFVGFESPPKRIVSSEKDHFTRLPPLRTKLFEIYGRSFFKPLLQLSLSCRVLFARSAELVTSRHLLPVLAASFGRLVSPLSARRTLASSPSSFPLFLFGLSLLSPSFLRSQPAPVSFTLPVHQAPFFPFVSSLESIPSRRARTLPEPLHRGEIPPCEARRRAWLACRGISRDFNLTHSGFQRLFQSRSAIRISRADRIERAKMRRLARSAFNSRRLEFERLELVPDRSRQRKRGEGQDKGLPRKDPGTEPDDRSFGNYETGLPSLLAAEGVIESSNVPVPCIVNPADGGE